MYSVDGARARVHHSSPLGQECALSCFSFGETCAPAGGFSGGCAPSALPGWQLGKDKGGMAAYHCSVKVGGKGKAAAHAQYIAREGKYSGYEQYEDLEATGRGNMPAWAEHNPAHFWEAADQFERANGATYREIEVALPRELTPDQRRELVEDFIQQELGERHAYQWAIHCPAAAIEGGEQPHAHIMYSERTVDGIDRDPEQYFKRYNAKAPEKGGCRKDSAGTPERLQATRERWATVQNAHLERHGHAARVDHRSLEAQGVQRQPEKHIGWRRMAKADPAALRERRAAERELDAAERDLAVIDIGRELAKATRELSLGERMERTQRLIQERQAAIADLAERRSELYKLHRTALPRAQVDEAKQEAAELAKAVRVARNHVQALEAESEGLSPLRFIRRKQLDRELPEARRRAEETAARLMDTKKVAERPVREEVDSELDHIAKAIEPGETLARDARIELMALEGQEKALEARQEALEMARQVRAAAEASRAAAAASQSAVKQSQATRERERDQGHGLGM